MYPATITSVAVPHWAALALALALLNAGLTLAPIWPTPFVRLSGDVSLELAVCVLALVVAWRRATARRRVVRALLAAAWVLLVFGRYASVMSQALWGRDINLYWDMPHVPAVGAMLAFVASPQVLAGVAAALILVPLVLFLPARWAFGRVIDAAAPPRLRRVMAAAAILIAVAGAVQRLDGRVPQWPGVATPVTLVWAQQLRLLAYEMSGAGLAALGDPPRLPPRLDGLEGADVILLFVESYGAVSWERPAFAGALAAPRAGLSRAIADTGRGVASAYVESPTFGGESWLAHVSFLSGTEVRDGATNARLMGQARETMVTAFTRSGYRAVAVMPGIQSVWPEGRFYGFDQVYGATQLAYKGPSFGWWDLTDQYALARLDAAELARAPRPPVFAFFPTISTHTPFTPAPPYQPDWPRVLTDRPYDAAALEAAYAEPADWLDLGPGYVRAVTYAFDTVAGYLRRPATRDLVLIVIGDHQPPAMVSGEGAPWDVPIHVIASRPRILERLQARGFRPGLEPQRPTLARMHAVMPIVMEAFAGQ